MTRLKLPHIHEYRDRHGKVRRYVRRPGMRQIALPGLPGSPEFMEAYQAAMTGVSPAKAPRHKPGSLGALAEAFYASTEFTNLKLSSQVTYRRVLDPVLRADGHRLVRDLPADKASKIIQEIGVKRHGMANLTRAVLRRMMSLAIRLNWRTTNPFDQVPLYKLGKHHTWTEEQLEAYEARWPLGTRERLGYELLLYTAQRVGDVVRMQRSDIRNGAIAVVQDKTATPLLIAIHPSLARAMKAGPSKGLYLIGDKDGRPIKRAALSVLIAKACDKAGLPAECVAHGLRKAIMRRLAEAGSTTKEMQAVSGHRTLSEIERYTRDADQKRLARMAIGNLPDKRG
jgi:integrase